MMFYLQGHIWEGVRAGWRIFQNANAAENPHCYSSGGYMILIML